MANFTISPATGNGTTNITVTPSGYNTDGEDRVSTLTLSNSINTKQVALRQKYQPIMNQFGSTNFPASGGNIYFTVRTEYDIVFRSVPSWIRIFNDSTGVEYSEGERISFTGLTANTTFRLTAEPNPTQSSRSISSTFNMGHYIGNALQNRVSYFSFTQDAGEIPPSPSTSYLTYYLSTNLGSNEVDLVIELTSYQGMTDSTRVYCTQNMGDSQDLDVYLDPTGDTQITLELDADRIMPTGVGDLLARVQYGQYDTAYQMIGYGTFIHMQTTFVPGTPIYIEILATG